ncbi:MAG TPA: adenylate/guanylate cyclase domain-containing protein [Thermoanaerobaculaceae bacterium]|nr:adenylate/guanylate cyclase domain-containing protein [Thermoanaerobaculaceae bacterium]HRS16669.1 adenylate/guanylate cyclase domain-containing protein [Thermoanaerobaculaceae bacterium]
MCSGARAGRLRGFLRGWGAALGIGVAVFAILSGLRHVPFFQSLERTTRDWRVRVRAHPALRWAQAPMHVRHDRLVVVPIDDATLQSIPEPMLFWTGRLAAVLAALDRAGATVVVLDLQLQVSGEQVLNRRIEKQLGAACGAADLARRMGEGDASLFAALGTGKVILLSYVRPDGVLQAPWPPYRHAAGDANLGLGNVEVDDDGVVRRQLLYRTALLPDGSERPFFGLALLAACRMLEVEPTYDGEKFGLAGQPVPHDASFTFEVNYLGPPGTLLDGPGFGELVERAERGDESWLAEHFSGRLVLIGPAHSGSNDLVVTPAGGERHGEMYGVELQANAARTLLNRDFLVEFSGVGSVALLVLCLGGAAVCRARDPVPAALVLAAAALAWAATGTLLLCRLNAWVELAAPLVALPAVFTGVFTWRYRAEYRTRRHVRSVLGRYVSENVAREILEDPARLALGGSRREVSILFCDLNGFTDMSEGLEPEQVIATLNDYFARMERVIFRHGGTLKQFVGDEIMVICGAPAADSRHAATACRIALDMESELLRWQQECREAGRPILDAKLGIHSGQVVAGNVGSPNRSEYATVGDVVNTASRIMGLSKRLGRRILVSEDTCRMAGDAFRFQDLGWHGVRGRSQQVHAFALAQKGEGGDNESDASCEERQSGGAMIRAERDLSAAVLLAAALLSAAIPSVLGGDPVAAGLVLAVTGRAFVKATPVDRSLAPMALVDRGETIATGRDGTVTVLFFPDGRTYTLMPGASARLGEKAVDRLTGSIAVASKGVSAPALPKTPRLTSRRVAGEIVRAERPYVGFLAPPPNGSVRDTTPEYRWALARPRRLSRLAISDAAGRELVSRDVVGDRISSAELGLSLVAGGEYVAQLVAVDASGAPDLTSLFTAPFRVP